MGLTVKQLISYLKGIDNPEQPVKFGVWNKNTLTHENITDFEGLFIEDGIVTLTTGIIDIEVDLNDNETEKISHEIREYKDDEITISLGEVVYVYNEDTQTYPESDPQIIEHIRLTRTGRALFETEALNGISMSKNLDLSEIKKTESKKIPAEYNELINKVYYDTEAKEETDLYGATYLQVLTGKQVIETHYDEWFDYFQESYEFLEYLEDNSLPVNELELDAIYAVDVVHGGCYPIRSVQDLEKVINNRLTK